MSGANICDTEEYKSAAGIFKKCSVECINLILGGDKDSLQNLNCKKFCGGCYAYYSTKADTETTALPDFTSPSTAVTNPTTAIDATTAPCPPCYETTLTVLVVLIPLIIIVVIVASCIFKPVQNFWRKLLDIKQPHPNTQIPLKEKKDDGEEASPLMGRGQEREQDRDVPEEQGAQQSQSEASERGVPDSGRPQQNPEDPSAEVHADTPGEADPKPGNIDVPGPPTPSTDSQPSTTPHNRTLEREVHKSGEETEIKAPHGDGGICEGGAVPQETGRNLGAGPCEEAGASYRKDCTDSFIAQTQT
ncbi:uncharacterized protein LOC135490750 isoform X1 [Lineus longissimus]|uniref:uncharacterized protein LOC135490750 isoform X1 n=1 Tax=Lineus longissimus TaxID=88925 RepID=UPI00315DFF0B